jgi:hypothetical protein
MDNQQLQNTVPVQNLSERAESTSSSLNPAENKRLNIDMTPDTYELLQSLSQKSGKNMAEVLKTGLLLYGIAQEETQKGNNISITHEEKILVRFTSI